jgi:hypothetical protein
MLELNEDNYLPHMMSLFSHVAFYLIHCKQDFDRLNLSLARLCAFSHTDRHRELAIFASSAGKDLNEDKEW